MEKQMPGKRPAPKDASNYSEPFTKIPNWILDDPTLRPAEFRVLLHIVRETAGWQKKNAGISLGRFEKATGLAKNTILNAIKSLRKKGIISVSSQHRKDGGSSYSRFRIKGGSKTEPGGGQELNGGPTQKMNPTKETNIKDERENIIDDGGDAVLPPDGNIHLAMSENERLMWMSRYTEKVSLEARNPQAYKRKIMRQLEREEPSTLKALESFVLDEVEADFLEKLPIQVGDERIESVYTYRQSKGFDPAWKILVESRDGDGGLIRRTYPAPHLLELEIEEGLLLPQRIIYEEEL